MTMNSAAWFLTGATLGSAIGVGITYIYLKDKFDKSLTEEVEALRAHYVERDRKMAELNEEKKKELEERLYSTEHNTFTDYARMYGEETQDDKVEVVAYNEVVENSDDYSAAAEIISEVGWDGPDFDDYRKISGDDFEDGAVCETRSGEELDGFESIAGSDWKEAFGEYTPNVVYVRNHELKTDYEIIEQEGPSPRPEDE